MLLNTSPGERAFFARFRLVGWKCDRSKGPTTGPVMTERPFTIVGHSSTMRARCLKVFPVPAPPIGQWREHYYPPRCAYAMRTFDVPRRRCRRLQCVANIFFLSLVSRSTRNDAIKHPSTRFRRVLRPCAAAAAHSSPRVVRWNAAARPAGEIVVAPVTTTIVCYRPLSLRVYCNTMSARALVTVRENRTDGPLSCARVWKFHPCTRVFNRENVYTNKSIRSTVNKRPCTVPALPSTTRSHVKVNVIIIIIIIVLCFSIIIDAGRNDSNCCAPRHVLPSVQLFRVFILLIINR